MRKVAAVGVVALVCGSRTARADHQHGAISGASEQPSMSFGAALSLVAAQFDTLLYGGDYEGLTPSLRWSRGRFAAFTSLGLYRLYGNGRTSYGPGDLTVQGQARLVGRRSFETGLALAVTAPTGDERRGFGMGHPMLMPAVWGRFRTARVTVDASAGYARALGAAASHHAAGAWPLVDPMNVEELTWTAAGEVALVHDIRAGARLGGGIPIATGVTRVFGGARVSWSHGRVDSAVELQAGLAGDPFTLRGVVETALSF